MEKIYDLDSTEFSALQVADFENFFDIYDYGTKYKNFNLNKTWYFNVDENAYSIYTLTHDAQWPLISYKIYGTTRLAWLLMKLNKISGKDIFKLREAGETILYLDKNKYVESLLTELNGFEMQ